MTHFVVGLGIKISDTRHVQDTSHVLEHGNGNNVNFLVPITVPKVLFLYFLYRKFH